MYKGIAQFVAVFFILILISNLGYAQTSYYISSQGNDSNNGTSESSAWKTIAKVNSSSFNPGDIVKFKGGQKFADAILNCKAGVTYNSFGTGKATLGDSISTLTTTETIQIVQENVTIDNLKIYSYSNAVRAISISAGNLTIENCEIYGGYNSHVVKAIGIETMLSTITDPISITKNIIRDFDKGIGLRQPYNVDIGYNTIYNMFRWDGYQNVGGECIRFFNNTTDGFDCEYTVNIHHNDMYNFEHFAIGVGNLKRIIVEYNYVHDNLDERLYMGGMKHGTVGKFWDNSGTTGNSDAGTGKIFRYNYVYNIQRRGQPGYTYGRSTIENIKAGIPNVISSGGTNTLPIYVTSQGGTWSSIADAIIGGLGYANVWVHNNIFYKSTHIVFGRGYSYVGANTSNPQLTFDETKPSYFVNNTIADCGNSTLANDYGVLVTEVTSQSPHYSYNNIVDMPNSYPRIASRYKEEQNYVDYNIYTSPRTGTTTSSPSYDSGIATWFQYSTNNENGEGEQYETDLEWADTSSTIFAANIGPNGIYIPDFRIVQGGKAYNTGKDYNTIGDTYTDSYGTHVKGQDPTGRSFAYDVLGNLRTTNDIGAVGTSDNSNGPIGLEVILEAPFVNGIMETNLNSLNLLPVYQPYNVSPWNVNDNSVLNNPSPNYVDWILVQLKENLTNTEYSKAAILTKDGTVLNSDGSAFSFSNISSGQYYIVIKHRNHLGIMSSGKIQINNNEEVQYDFTDSQSKAYGENAMADLGNGRYAMFVGDADANGVINVLDYAAVGNNLFFTGYAQGDVDMNGVVNILDYSFINKNIFKATNLP